jgi:hypothetical protein
MSVWHELKAYYRQLNQAPQLKWAKLWGSLTLLLLGVVAYHWWSGRAGLDLGLILAMPILFAAVPALEAFNAARRYVRQKHFLETYYSNLAVREAPAQPQEVEEIPELDDDQKLLACQYYVFLYLLFEARKVGENTLEQLAGIPVKRYRAWLDGLVRLGLVSKSPGKVEVSRLELAEVMRRTAHADGLPLWVWNFPARVYQDSRNWQTEQPPRLKLEAGRTAKLGGRVKALSDISLPRYPHRLEDLFLEPEVEES